MGCSECAYYISSKCVLFGDQTSSLRGCPYQSSFAYKCEFCGKYLTSEQVIIVENKIICDSCLKLLSTCKGCKNSIIACRFEQDRSVAETPYIVQTQRVNGGQIQQQVRNPARIEKTCKLCKCFNGEYCGREYNWCSNHGR